MDRVRNIAEGAAGFSKQEIQHVDAMGRDVTERAASSLRGIDEPTALTSLFIPPFVASEFGQDRFAVGARIQQLFRALHFWVGPAVVGHAKFEPRLFCCLYHR